MNDKEYRNPLPNFLQSVLRHGTLSSHRRGLMLPTILCSCQIEKKHSAYLKKKYESETIYQSHTVCLWSWTRFLLMCYMVRRLSNICISNIKHLYSVTHCWTDILMFLVFSLMDSANIVCINSLKSNLNSAAFKVALLQLSYPYL